VKVFLVRHAHAVDEDAVLSDADRFLSARGRETAKNVGRRLKETGIAFDALLTSPLVRAVQTAELLAGALELAVPVSTWPPLAPGGSLRRTADELASRGALVACVGHEPSISALCAMLAGRPSFPSFRPGQVTLVEDGRAVWTLSPDTLELARLG
jgi:phosphohistidine phosphatase